MSTTKQSSFDINRLYAVKDKIVVITGGGSGLGKAIAEGFAVNGARVYIVGRRQDVLEKAKEQIGGDIHTIQGDQQTEAGCQAIVEAVKAKESHNGADEAKALQQIDTLVNCAGVGCDWKVEIDDHDDADQVENLLMHGLNEDDFNKSNQINTMGVYFLTANFIPLLRASADPNVCVIASVAAMGLARTLGTITYGISKAATLHLARLLAGRLHPMKIRVNTICPGIFPSEMTGETTDGSEKHGYNLGTLPDKAAKRCTAGRPGRAEEIVGPIMMLSSPAGAYMNCALLTVDGGRMMGHSIHDGLRLPEDTYV